MQTGEDATPNSAYISYDDIPPLPADVDQQQLLAHIHAKFGSKLWTDNMEAVNYLRQINKSFPESSNQVCEIFWTGVTQALETAKTTVCKTALVYFQEVFVRVGGGLNDAIIRAVTPSIMQKTQHTNTVIKTEAQRCVEYLIGYCVKESLIVALCGCCVDKNPKIAELAFKALEKTLGAVNQQLMYAQADTFKAIFAASKEALTGKRSELKKHASTIVKGIFQVLGDANFTQLIQLLMTEGILVEKDVDNIRQSFGDENEQKLAPLAEVLKGRRKQANAELFQGF